MCQERVRVQSDKDTVGIAGVRGRRRERKLVEERNNTRKDITSQEIK